jgi:hypothetical protein
LFFIGTIGALAVRHYVAPAQPAATERPRTAAARIERLAAPLPPADAEKLRAAFRAREARAEGARETLNRAFERIQAPARASLRRGATARRDCEGACRATGYEQAMQEILAAATEMSPRAAASSPTGRRVRPQAPADP